MDLVRAVLVIFTVIVRASAITLDLQKDVKSTQLWEVVQKMKRQKQAVCITTAGPYMGGMANVVAFFNEGLDFSLQADVPFVFPPLHSSATTHKDIGDEFVNLFGKATEAEDACGGAAYRYQATCERHCRDFGGADFCGPEESWAGTMRCPVANMTVDIFSDPPQQHAHCRCPNLLVLDAHSMAFWGKGWDYSRTQSFLAKSYWKEESEQAATMSLAARTGKAASKAFNVVAHVRLGDVIQADKHSKIALKRADPEWVLAALRRIANLLPASCAQFSIVTDATDTEGGDIGHIVKRFAELSDGRKISVLGPQAPTADAFRLMTHADVLIAGGSDFSRLAAVLAREHSAVFVQEFDNAVVNNVRFSRPDLEFLPNRTTLPLTDLKEMGKRISENDALQRLSAACSSGTADKLAADLASKIVKLHEKRGRKVTLHKEGVKHEKASSKRAPAKHPRSIQASNKKLVGKHGKPIGKKAPAKLARHAKVPTKKRAGKREPDDLPADEELANIQHAAMPVRLNKLGKKASLRKMEVERAKVEKSRTTKAEAEHVEVAKDSTEAVMSITALEKVWKVNKTGYATRYQAFMDEWPVSRYNMFSSFSRVTKYGRHKFPATVLKAPGLFKKFDWVLTGPYSHKHGEDPHSLFVQGTPDQLDSLLQMAKEQFDPTHRKRVLVFGGSDMWLSEVLTHTDNFHTTEHNPDGYHDIIKAQAPEMNSTLATLHKYFGRIYFEAKDMHVGDIRTMPIGLTEFNLRRQDVFETCWPQVRDASVSDEAKPNGVLAAFGIYHDLSHCNRGLGRAVQLREEAREWSNSSAARAAGVRTGIVEPLDWWKTLASHKFMMAPAGCGVQAPKQLEALMVLTIPIHHRAFPAWDDLKSYGFPIVVVSDWNEVTSKALNGWWKELSPRLVNFRQNCLTTEGYWKLFTGQVEYCS